MAEEQETGAGWIPSADLDHIQVGPQDGDADAGGDTKPTEVPASKTKAEKAAERYIELGPVRNSDGAAVAFGTDALYSDTVYCGRRLGQDAIQRSDGRCGPNNGPQCNSCRNLQYGPGRLDLLRRRVPNVLESHHDGQFDFGETSAAVLVAALRKQGGIYASAVQHLKSLGAKEVPPEFALPQEEEVLGFQVDQDLLAQLVETFQVSCEVAETALREHSNNADRAGSWIADEIQAVRDAAEARAHNVMETEEKAKRDRIQRFQVVKGVFENNPPSSVQSLGTLCSSFLPLIEPCREGTRPGVVAGEGQHRMILRNEGPDGNCNIHCLLCSGPVPSAMCGSYKCELCNLCEGCVQSKVVVMCPRLANGGHLHHHMATYALERVSQRVVCDVKGEGCQRHSCIWTCRRDGCDFDACFSCMSRAAPDDFDRRAGVVVPSSNDQDSGSDAVRLHFTPIKSAEVERRTAARWEGNYQEITRAGVSVGAGQVVVRTSTPSVIGQPSSNNRTRRSRNGQALTDTGRLVQRSSKFHSTPAFLTESKLSAPCVLALEQCRKKPKRGGSGMLSATDLTLAEDILQRTRGLENQFTKQDLCVAIAGGSIGVAGTLLLSEVYAPMPPKEREGMQNNDSVDEQLQCLHCGVCKEEINVKLAPDGAVGCLTGHAMHSACAADLLLGGGDCPTCRGPLFFPRIEEEEVRSASVMAENEIERIKQMEEEMRRVDLDSGDETVGVGDIVRICPQVDICSKVQQKDPRSGGWHEDMSSECGNDLCVFKRIEDDSGKLLAITARPLLQDRHKLVPLRRNRTRCTRCGMSGPSRQTGTKRCKMCTLCQTCCSKTAGTLCEPSNVEVTWDASLINLVRRAKHTAVGDEACASQEEAVANAAKKHLVRLRSELAAVKAGREKVEKEIALEKPTKESLTRDLSSNSDAAVQHIWETVSAADWERARQLLLLARDWGDSKEARGMRATLYTAVRAGDLDSVARVVRRYNAQRSAEAAKWLDALVDKHEYIVQPNSTVNLRAFPSLTAPKTGFRLDSNARFRSEAEILDSCGLFWLKVDPSFFFDQSQMSGNVCSITTQGTELVGARVTRRDSSWHYGNQDGGSGKEGTVISAGCREGQVIVAWDINPKQPFCYNTGLDAKFDLCYAKPRPPPQGWVCVRPGGNLSAAVVTLSRSPLCCYGCGDGLTAPKLGREKFLPAKISNLKNGSIVYVAATLERVRVERVTPSGRVFCSFLFSTHPDREDSSIFWYAEDDLVLQDTENSTSGDGEVLLIDDARRTRREVVLLKKGDGEAARHAWDEAKAACQKVPHNCSDDFDTATFASCARGHLLHARCFQAALLAGKTCPAPGCSESLWVPKVRFEAEEGDNVCCGGAGGAEADAMHEDTVTIATRGERIEAASEEAGYGAAGFSANSLKMCPACCSGPLLNTNCADMRAHHGQCSKVALGSAGSDACTPNGLFVAKHSEIASKLVSLAPGQSVADVLPKCPKHNVAVMFNGCLSCGHLFIDTSWQHMPTYDPNAKAILEVDQKKRKIASMLASQIRKEAAMLRFERDALSRRRSSIEDVSEVFNDGCNAPPPSKTSSVPGRQAQSSRPPAPAMPAYEVNLNEPGNMDFESLFAWEMDDAGDY